MDIDSIELSKFLKKVYDKYGDDFLNYHYKTLKRRIETHCISLNIDNFIEYCTIILKEENIYDEMFKYFSINVTEFFREPEQFKIFREKVIPYLKTFNHIKIWCAGCSSGELPYSLSIILEEEGLLDKSQIYATDFNNRVLAKAKDGLFDIKDLEKISSNYKKSGGKKEFEDYFLKYGKYKHIKKYLQEHILFFNHNLVTDGIMNEFKLIICKNVIIYFNDILKNKVINLFNDSLECNGFLILGNTEYLPIEFKDEFKHYIPKSKVYHKICK